jgi:hypothetical protein
MAQNFISKIWCKAHNVKVVGSRVSYGGGGFTPGMNLTWGMSPHQLEVFGVFSSGFENLIIMYAL